MYLYDVPIVYAQYYILCLLVSQRDCNKWVLATTKYNII